MIVRKHILDALPFLGSSAAVKVMADIIITKGVPKETVHEWLVAFPFIPHPNEAILGSLLKLLQYDTASGKNFDPAVALSVSSVAHSFCRHRPYCGDVDELDNIVRELQKRAIKSYKTPSQDDRVNRENVGINIL